MFSMYVSFRSNRSTKSNRSSMRSVLIRETSNMEQYVQILEKMTLFDTSSVTTYLDVNSKIIYDTSVINILLYIYLKMLLRIYYTYPYSSSINEISKKFRRGTENNPLILLCTHYFGESNKVYLCKYCTMESDLRISIFFF